MNYYILKLLSNFYSLHFSYYYIKNKLKKKKFRKSLYHWLNLRNPNFIVMPTFPSSRYHMLQHILSCYFSLKKFKKFEFDYDKNNYYRTRKFKNICIKADGGYSEEVEDYYDFYIMHTHKISFAIPGFLKKLQFNKKIFLLRDSYSNLYSYYKKTKNFNSFGDFLNYNNKIYLRKYVEFFNSYEKYICDDNNSLKIFDRELINKTEKLNTFQNIINFLEPNKKIDLNLLTKSLNFFDLKKENIRDKKKENVYMSASNYDSKFLNTEKNIIYNYLNKNLNYKIKNFFASEKII